jgi:hypothetical protein
MTALRVAHLAGLPKYPGNSHLASPSSALTLTFSAGLPRRQPHLSPHDRGTGLSGAGARCSPTWASSPHAPTFWKSCGVPGME